MTEYQITNISTQLVDASIKYKKPMCTSIAKWPDTLVEAFHSHGDFEIVKDDNGNEYLRLSKKTFDEMFSDCQCCDNVRRKCISCTNMACHGCRTQCTKCNNYSCNECLIKCSLCNKPTCPACIRECNAAQYVGKCDRICCPKCMGGCRGWDDCCRRCQDF
jgi:hypothetical protein